MASNDDALPPSSKRAKCLSISEQLLEIEGRFCEELRRIEYGASVSYVYNPLEYASEPHGDFVRKYGNGKKKILFLGMNPGPFGMAQNGVPFGDPKMVREWLKVSGKVGKPAREHPKRPIIGLQLAKSEVSGSRFWGFFQTLCGDPDVFFANCFVSNYCPACFMSQTGKNITPPTFKVDVRGKLEGVCDAFLREVVQTLGVECVIGVGQYAEARAKVALNGDGVKVWAVMHPSPINPAANKEWPKVMTSQLTELGVLELIRGHQDHVQRNV